MTLKQYIGWGIAGFIIGFGVMQISAPLTFGASVFATFQGGTGTSSPSGILYGSGSATALQTVGIGSGLTFSGGTLSSSATPSPATSTNPLMATYMVATSTTQASTFPYASTTAWSITSTSTGSSGIQLSGGCFAMPGGACITSSASSPATSTNPLMATYFVATSTTQASSFPIASTTLLSTLTKAFFGSSATSTFDSTGFLTLPSGFLSQASSTVSALLTATNASTTNLVASTFLAIPTTATCGSTLGATCLDTTENQLQVGTSTTFNAVYASHIYKSFTFSTSTTAAGTSTQPLEVVMPSAGETLVASSCYMSLGGNWNVQFGNGIASTTGFVASTTANRITYTTGGGIFARGNIIYAAIGTPASAPTKMVCTNEYTINPS